jgi:hypothetical protein
MREEVETEFTERMEQLRNMYMTEIESQAEKMEEEKARANRGQCYKTFYSRKFANLRVLHLAGLSCLV